MVRTRKYHSFAIVAAFLLPSLLGFLLFFFLPIVSTLGLSLTRYSGGRTASFVGLNNYLTAFRSRTFQNSLLVTFNFVVFSVLFQILLGFIFAVLLNKQLFARDFFRSLFFLPTVLSTIAVAISFMLILNPSKGPANDLLVFFGLRPLPWLASPRTALATIVSVTIWQSFGYYMVIFLSGLQSINPNLYETADIDGATAFQKLRYVTIPMLTPTTFFCFTVAIIKAFQVFDQIFIMTGGQGGGGPAGSTSVIVFVVYSNAFYHFRMGYASAQSVILLIIVLLITVIQYRKQRKWVGAL